MTIPTIQAGTAVCDYRILECIHIGARSEIYRAEALRGGQKVILKLPAAGQDPSEAELRLGSEHNMLLSLRSQRVVQTLGLSRWDGLPVLALDNGKLGTDPKDCRSLRAHMDSGVLGGCGSPDRLALLIRIFQSLVRAIDDVHKADLIHKHVSLDNVLYSLHSDAVMLIDFGICARGTSFGLGNADARAIEGTLDGLSPEQSGLIHRGIDWRSDYYSLGALMYWLCTGQPLFDEPDRISLVHAHIARTPAAPHEISPDVPLGLSRVIMKLLRKDPGARYRSCQGILYDLDVCLELGSGGSAADENFVLATHDISQRFSFPDPLYGRREEIGQLLSAFVAAQRQHSRIALIKGASGMGKTSLAYDLFHSPETIGMLFCRGIFDRQVRSTPFGALLTAFDELISLILHSGSDQLTQWKQDWRQILAHSGPVLASLLPGITRIIGRQPEVPALPAQESQALVLGAFTDLIKAIEVIKRPLVILLDNIQWADQASIDLMGRIAASLKQSRGILLVFTCRSEELMAGDAVSLTLEGLQNEHDLISSIELNPLARDAALRLINDTYPMEPNDAQGFGQAVWQVCGGNPFFLRQMLESLYSMSMPRSGPEAREHSTSCLEFHSIEGIWSWNERVFGQIAHDADLHRFLERRITDLPVTCRQTLNAAACIGHEFSFGELAAVLEKDAYSIIRDIQTAVTTGFLRPVGMSYRVVAELSREIEAYLRHKAQGSCRELFFRFVHDQIVEYLQQRTPPAEQSLWHYRIAMHQYRSSLSSSKADEQVFSIANHLNQGAHHLIQDGKAELLIQLNARACRLSLDSVAYVSAYSYFERAHKMVQEHHWQDDYFGILQLYIDGIEAASLSDNHAMAENLFYKVLERCLGLGEKIELYTIIIRMHTNLNHMEKGIDLAAQALSLTGEDLPRGPEAIAAGIGEQSQEIAALAAGLPGGIEDYANMPPMEDEMIQAAMEIMINVSSTAYMTDANLYMYIVLRMVSLSLQHGSSNVSAFGFVNYALVLAGAYGDYANGYRYGLAALALLAKHPNPELGCKVNHVFGAGIQHWKNHIRSCIPYFEKAYLNGVQFGDVLYAGYTTNQRVTCQLIAGCPLEEVRREHSLYYEFIRRHKDPVVNGLYALQLQIVRNLQGEIVDVRALTDELLPEDEIKRIGSIILDSNYDIARLQLCFIYRHFASAEQLVDASAASLGGSFGSVLIAEQAFYAALCLYAAIRSGLSDDATARLKQADDYLASMQIWADHCPQNNYHRLLLMKAERSAACLITGGSEACRNGESDEALDAMAADELYRAAITEAERQGFIQIAALANECAGRYYMEAADLLPDSRTARDTGLAFMKKALAGLREWGAVRKVHYLRQEFPELS